MSFELPKLNYAYDALEPVIDARTMEIHTTPKKLFTVSALSIGAIMFAQEQDSLRTKSIDDVVITGNANPKASIKTSTSISTLKMKEIINAAPRTTAEIFRTIPVIS